MSGDTTITAARALWTYTCGGCAPSSAPSTSRSLAPFATSGTGSSHPRRNRRASPGNGGFSMFAPPISQENRASAASPSLSGELCAGGDGGTTLFRSVRSDEGGGNPANIAASESSNQIQRDARAAPRSSCERRESRADGGGFSMFAPPIWRRRWRNNAFPFRQIRRRRRQPSEHRRERSEQSNRARCASSSQKGAPHSLR